MSLSRCILLLLEPDVGATAVLFAIGILILFAGGAKYSQLGALALLFVLLILNNPQITVYHKYFDPLLIIMFFTLFNFDKVIENFNKIKSYSIIYFYFLFFLFLNNIKTLWIIN